jgi:hypothetical protein
MVVLIRDKRKLIGSNLCIPTLETEKIQQRARPFIGRIFYVFYATKTIYSTINNYEPSIGYVFTTATGSV